MAYTNARTHTAGFSGGTLGLGSLVARFTAWNEARRTHDALSRLSLHELEDIGLTKGDIDRIAKRSF